MHKKTFLLLAIIVFVTITVLLSPVVFATTQTDTGAASARFDSGDDPLPTPGPEDVEIALPPAGKPAFFIISGSPWTPRPGQPYHADGAYNFWNWSQFNYARGQYNFDKLDLWIQNHVNAGFKSVGIALNTYTGRSSAKNCEQVKQGVDATPKYVQNGPDGVFGTSDDVIFASAIPDGRQYAGCTNYGGPWYLLDYNDPFYMQEYSAFIHALADHLLNSPYRDNIAWISIGTGKDGENKPADDYLKPDGSTGGNLSDDDSLLPRVSQDEWIAYVKDVMDEYTDAFYDSSGFPRIGMTIQNAPFYRSPWERKEIASYASQKGVGISINGMTSDFVGGVLCPWSDPTWNCTGMYDQAILYQNSIPIQLETYGYMTGTENEVYGAFARALHLRSDYIRLSTFWTYPGMDTAVNRDTAKWTTKYLGKGFLPGQEEPPSIWSRMREHRNPTIVNYYTWHNNSDYWPVIGNYEFFLTQRHLPLYNAVTIPVTDDPRITFTGSGYLPEYRERWHTNNNPFDQKMYDAHLFHLNRGEEGVQQNVDPGWVARRSDQATNQYRFIFDAADRYFPQTNPPTTYKAIVTVTYLDTGTDRWYLQYDSVDGPKRATLYAVNDWTPQRGLALDGGLPTTGVLATPQTYVQKTGSGMWKVATFLIEDGNFNNGLFGGNGDIAIDTRDPDSGAKDGDEYIHHVDVQKVDEFVEPVKTGVEGFVYVDMNENGIRDAWEPGIHNATVTLAGANQYQTTTTGSGYYQIEDAVPGQYTLSATPPSGYQQLDPPNIAIFINDGNMLRVDFKHPPIETQTYLYLPMMQTP